MEDKNVLNFFFELGQLQNVDREGWKLTGITNPESVADHSLRSAQIAYFLAKMEGHDPHRPVLISVFHDINECRVGDLTKVAQRYIELDEDEVMQEQLNPLGGAGKDLLNTLQANDAERRIAKDADVLEMLVRAKEYMDQGYTVRDWFENNLPRLHTDSAKRLGNALRELSSTDWWQDLKQFDDI